MTVKHFLAMANSWICRELSQPRRAFVFDFDITVSFVCGFDDTVNIGHTLIPALWHVRGRESRVYLYTFPRSA